MRNLTFAHKWVLSKAGTTANTNKKIDVRLRFILKPLHTTGFWVHTKDRHQESRAIVSNGIDKEVFLL